MRCLIDVGNSITKVVLVDQGNFVSHVEWPTKSFQPKELLTLLKNSPKIQRVTLCSVVPKKNPVIQKVAKKLLIPIYTLDVVSQQTVKIKTKVPKEVGADLVACAAAVEKRTIIVDFGTATTISLVENKILQGVSIAPGLGTQLESIVKEAALLDLIELSATEQVIGQDTKEALLAGIVMGQAKMVEGVIASLGKADVVFTGGYASIINQTLGGHYNVDADLLMKGLLQIDGE
jgi:type III pantothenate kinase